MMKRLLTVLFVLSLTTIGFANTTLISTRGPELIVEYVIEPWEIESEGEFSRILAKNMDFSSESGAPLLPYDEFKIGLPPSGSFVYQIIDSQSSSIKLPSRLLPVPTVSMQDGVSDYKYSANSQLYTLSSGDVVETLPIQNFRGYDFAPFQLRPFSYDGNLGLKVLTKATIRIELQGNINYRQSEPGDAATDLFVNQLLNGETAKNWRSSPRAVVNYAPFSESDWWLRIETNSTGIYRLTPSQLSALPLQDIDPRQFRMFSTSGKVIPNTVIQPGPEFQEVPIMVSGEADGSFDAADYILFYGSSRDGYDQNTEAQEDDLYYNPYSQNQVFWLTFGSSFPGSPRRITLDNPTATPIKVTVNVPAVKQVEREAQRREETGLTWFSERLFGNSTSEYQFQTELSEVDVSGVQELTFRIRREDVASDLPNTINVTINGVPIVSNPATGSLAFIWYGSNYYTFNRSVSGFVNGLNTITIKVIRYSTINLFFDWYRISYRQNLSKGDGQKLFSHPTSWNAESYRFALSGNLSNTLLLRANSIYDVQQIPLQSSEFISKGTSSSQYLLFTLAETYSPASIQLVEPVDLTLDTSQTDNIIIVPPEFVSRAQVLAQKYWDTYRVRSRVVLQDDIFNSFSGGHPDPAAIRQAIRYYYFNLPAPKISSVTLLGLGTLDWRNFSGSSAAKNKIMVWAGDYLVSDDYYGMISSSYYPELAIGRYPVKNLTELDIMLQNFSNYTENPTSGWWRNSMVFLGDDLNNGTATYEHIHTQQTEEAGNIVNPSILVDKIFAMEYEYDEFQNKPRARDDLFAAINEGRLVSCYIGHGSYDKLGAEDYLSGASDMNRFTNSGKLPFFIASSCKVSQFDYWGFDSLDQKMVLLNDRGAIASYGAARVSYPDNNQPMLLFLLKSLANNRNALGYAVMDAKIRYTGNNNNDAIYFLFGDPIIRVVPPVRDSTMQVTGMGIEQYLSARETARISGSFMAPALSGETTLRAYGSKSSYSLGPQTTVSHWGKQLFRGSAEVSASAYNSGFIVPDDVVSGATGVVVAYLWDASTKKDYTNYLSPLQLSDQALAIDNPDAPQVEIFLGTYDFRAGDTVSTNTTLYAKISDSNGINITGSPGHNIMLVIDNSLQPISLTPYFSYDKGSYTAGSLAYPMPQLSEGSHTVQVIAFDNFNLPSVASTQFVTKQGSELSIERLLVYPNPIEKDAYISFIISAETEVNIDFYTVRGKRIRKIKTSGRQGFNSIYWDGKDEQGASLANNTYFVKVKARNANGQSVELTEKLVVYKP